MSAMRGRKRDVGSGAERLPDLEFLALVRASLEAYAPGVTRGAELKGNSLVSPQGWVVGVTPPRHGGGHHYDLIAMPDVTIQPDVPCFFDCAVALSGDPRHAADAWTQTAGACLLELLDRRGRFAEHVEPGQARGFPGRHTITSGAIAFGLDPDENRRLQIALLEANVLQSVAGTFTSDLESPFFNGVKVFYGGRPGSMQAEIRVNGERHDAASAAMTALKLPEPATFAVARYYALLLPVPAGGEEPDYPATSLELDGEADHDARCACGGHPDPDHPGFDLALPHLIEELSDEERAQHVDVSTEAMIVARGIGNFLKVRLPVQLEDGRTVNYLAWLYVEAEVIEEVVDRVHDGTSSGHRFSGLFCNALGPWGEALLRAPVVAQGRPGSKPDAVGYFEVVESSDALLDKVLRDRWPAHYVLGDQDPFSVASSPVRED
ncbi:DUF6348 family protein [Amycolatopsis sp. NPDC059657]|uniref:DUF6348 family protein n=1 Tax=Amycolatopsis sp. NPDC059657 TaxID=3346899 RepID=UPI00366C6EA4